MSVEPAQARKTARYCCVDCKDGFDADAGVFDNSGYSWAPDEKKPRCGHCLARRRRLESEFARLSDDDLVSRAVRHAMQCGIQGSGLVVYCFATTDSLELDFACKEIRRRMALRPKETT